MPDTRTLSPNQEAKEFDNGFVPSIDLTSLWPGGAKRRDKTLKELEAALLGPGFFYAEDVGIDHALINTVLTQMDRFFGMGDQDPIKQAVNNQIHKSSRGWSPLFHEPAYQPGTISYVESFDCGPPELNQNLWPDLEGFRSTIEQYWYATKTLNTKLFEAIAEVLGLPSDCFSTHMGALAPCTLRLLHYPANTRAQDANTVGISAHTDFECCTLMYQTAAGLELTNREGEWVSTPPKDNEFVIIVGDMLERWTNGLLKATGHRVKNTTWSRYSIIMFFAADGDYVIEPLPQFVSSNNPARYRATTQSRHIEDEMDLAYANMRKPRA